MAAGYFVLALANLFPLAGLLLLGWSGESLLLLYLFESVVVLIVTARMLAVIGEREGESLALPFVARNIIGFLIGGVVWAAYFSVNLPGAAAALADPGLLLGAAGLL